MQALSAQVTEAESTASPTPAEPGVLRLMPTWQNLPLLYGAAGGSQAYDAGAFGGLAEVDTAELGLVVSPVPITTIILAQRCLGHSALQTGAVGTSTIAS